MMIKVGTKAPDFSLPSDEGPTLHLSGLRGRRLLLVFYPGDNTPVCTRQLCEYRDGIEDFEGLGVTVVGISSDSPETHQAFKSRHELPFTLLTDADLTVAEAYGARGMLGMKRAVFLLDEEGVIRYAHVETLALFRRTREELLEAIGILDERGPQSG